MTIVEGNLALFSAANERDFSFLAILMSSHVQSRQFVAWNIRTIVFLPISVFYILLFYSLSYVTIAVTIAVTCPVGWGWRIHWLHLCRGVRPPPHNECSGYDTKQSDGEVPAVLELWGMRSTPSLPSLPGPLWPGVVAPGRTLSMG